MMKPIKYKKAYELLIAREIEKWQYETFFKEVFRLIDDKTVINTDDEIINALKSGLIYYQDNAFYSNKGYFSIKISKALKEIGAKYSSWRKAYVLRADKLPLNVYSTIEMLRANTIERANLINAYLIAQLANIDTLMNKLIFDTAVETILQDLQKRVYANFKNAKIETIAPKINDFRANYIAQRYINNLKFWIKNWDNKSITEMRNTVSQMAIDGKSVQSIAQYISKRFGIDKRKSLFLARNETAIATTSYLTSKYLDEGFTRFQWITNYDGRERPLHHDLGLKTNNQYGINKTNIYRFDDPPKVDEHTGQHGYPGEAFNCRCHMIPIIDTRVINLRHTETKKTNKFVEIE